MQVDNEDFGKPVAEYFGVSGDGPQVSFSDPFHPFPPLLLFFGWKTWVGGGDLLYTIFAANLMFANVFPYLLFFHRSLHTLEMMMLGSSSLMEM